MHLSDFWQTSKVWLERCLRSSHLQNLLQDIATIMSIMSTYIDISVGPIAMWENVNINKLAQHVLGINKYTESDFNSHKLRETYNNATCFQFRKYIFPFLHEYCVSKEDFQGVIVLLGKIRGFSPAVLSVTRRKWKRAPWQLCNTPT